jgi:hypothetical protein
MDIGHIAQDNDADGHKQQQQDAKASGHLLSNCHAKVSRSPHTCAVQQGSLSTILKPNRLVLVPNQRLTLIAHIE